MDSTQESFLQFPQGRGLQLFVQLQVTGRHDRLQYASPSQFATLRNSSQDITAGLTFLSNTLDSGSMPVKSNPRTMCSVSYSSLCPASAASFLNRSKLLPLSTDLLLSDMLSFRDFSSVSKASLNEIHLLISSVLSKASSPQLLLRQCATVDSMSSGNREWTVVGCPFRAASLTNSSGMKCNPTVTSWI